MKRLFVLFLISALVIGACTALAADWTDGRSAAQPYSGVPEVDLNTTMGYIMMSPRAKLPVNHFCNELQIGPDGMIEGYHLRIKNTKLATVRAFQSIGYDTIAVGDSYNDLDMLKASKTGILFRSAEEAEGAFRKLGIL